MYSYKNDGIEVAGAALDEDDVQSLSRMVSTLLINADVVRNSVTVRSVAQNKPHKIYCEVPDTEPALPFIVSDLISIDRRFAKILMGLPIVKQVANYLEVPVEEVVFHFSNVTSKPAKYGPEISAHRDYPNQYFCPVSSEFIRVLIPVDPMSEKNGGLYFVRSSHFISDEEARSRGARNNDNVPSKVEYINALPGDLVFLNSKTMHGSLPNKSVETRHLLVVQYGIRYQELSVRNDEFMSLATIGEMANLEH